MADIQASFMLALGSNIALASLTPLAAWLFEYNRQQSNAPRKPVSISASVYDPYPVEQRTLAHTRALGGTPVHEWNMVMTAAAFAAYEAAFFASGTSGSPAVTINTPFHFRDTFVRCNAMAVYPHGEDIEYLRGHLLRVRQRFDAVVVI
jgi:hypothetical protein